MFHANRHFFNYCVRSRGFHIGLQFGSRGTCGVCVIVAGAMDGTPHILVVDDDSELRTLLSDFLSRSAYRVSVAQNGAAMMQTLGAARIDLIVLDIMMPGEDGLSLCRRLRAAGNIPVIMLTAMGSEMDRVVGLEMGADDYLGKPFSTRELLARVRAVLRRSAMPVRAPRPERGACSSSQGGVWTSPGVSFIRRQTPWLTFGPRSSICWSLWSSAQAMS